MANEFKVKKGLIVEGASGGTVVDVQGSQGQLFSVTDNLSGSIFAVSDISGVPILDVNSSGISYFDGSLGIGTTAPASLLEISQQLSAAATIDYPYTISSRDNNNSINQVGGEGVGIKFRIAGNAATTPGDSLVGASIAAIRETSSDTDSSTGLGFFVTQNDETLDEALRLDHNKNATFAGDVSISGGDLNVGNSSTVNSVINMLGTNDSFIEKDTGNHLYFANNVGDKDIKFRVKDDTTNVIALTIDGSEGGDATFVAQAFSAATSSGDASSTLTTKGYVDGLITGATIYRGAWDPSGGGYGSPDLSGVTQTSGYYYICSAAGTAEPNGTGTEPDTWAVGDWVIYNDVSGTGQWQKIDNSSVLSGVGTGQTVALWEGAGSVTDSETLGNAPITVSGNNTTFAGSGNFGGSVNIKSGRDLILTASSGSTDTGDIVFYHTGAEAHRLWSGTDTLNYRTDGGTTYQLLHSGNYSNYNSYSKLIVNNQINTNSSNLEINYENGDGTTTAFKDFYIRDGKNAIILNIQGSSKNATFAGTVTANKGIFTDGVTVTGNMSFFETTLTNNDDWQNSPISINERGNIGSSQSADKYAPNLNFHWGGVVSNSLWMGYNGQLNYGSYSSSGIPAAPGSGRINTRFFGGELIGAINTVTTGTTQTAGNNSTLIATTAYADAAAGAVPIGNYLPLAAGSGSSLTDNLYINDVDQNSFGRYGNLRSEVGFTRSPVTGNPNQWFKVVTLAGSPTRIKFSIIATGDNTNSYDNFLISTSGYGMNMHIEKLPGGRYNTSKLISVAVINPSNSGSVEIWIKLVAVSSGTGATYVACTADVIASATILASATTTAPNLTSNDTQLDISGDNRDHATIQTSRGATFGAKVGIGTNAPAAMLTVAGDSTISGNVGIGGGTISSKLFVNTDTVGDSYFRGGADNSRFLDFSTFATASPNAGHLINATSLNGEIAFATGGSEHVRIASTGNVGIGTDSPDDMLEVYGSSPNIRVTNTAETDAGIVFNDAQAGIGQMAAIKFNSGDEKLKFFVNDEVAQRMVIDTSGNVGIGATSPSYRLQVEQNNAGNLLSRFHNTNANGQGLLIRAGNVSSANRILQLASENDTKVMTVNSNGNVGIGTTSPNAKLEIGGAQNNALLLSDGRTASPGTLFDSSIAWDAFYSDAAKITLTHNDYNIGSRRLHFDVSGNEAMTIVHSGNVGIGTTSPSANLHVVGNATPNQYAAYIHNASGGGNVLKLYNHDWDTSDYLIYATNGGTASLGYAFAVDGNGRVGIGTTNPLTILHVGTGTSANLPITLAPASGGNVEFRSTTSTGSFTFTNANGSSEKMRIDSSGNVGIGTTSPRDTLEIEGNMRFVNGEDHLLIKPNSAIQGADFIVGDGVDPADTPIMSLDGLDGGKITIQTTVGTSTNANKTAFDVQGTQGQLFSVTDDLSGDIFAVSDISGVPIMTVNSSGVSYFDGNVGIGTTSPTRKLNVNGNVGINNQLLLDSANYNEHLAIRRGVYGYDTIVTGARIDYSPTASTNTFKFLADLQTTGQLNVTGNAIVNGNVGIGTTSPVQKLHIVDTDGANIILNSNTGAENNGIWMTEGGVATPYTNGAYFHYDSTNNLVRLNTGTTTLSTRFVVQRDTGKFIVGGVTANQTQSVMSSRQNGSSIEFGHLNQSGQYYGTLGAMASSGSPFIAFSADNSSGNTFTTRGAKGFVISQDTGISGDLMFSTVPLVNTANQGLVEKMRITSAGNVGIGTTSPAEKLEVAGSVKVGNMKFEPSNAGRIGFNRNPGNGVIYNSGYPAHQINGATSTNAFFEIQSYSATGGFQGTVAINAGNVGIGDTTPSYKLDVNGNGRFTSTVTATNFILSSDRRLKNNIERVDSNHIDVEWKTFEENSNKGQKRYGVIAQELEEKHPEFVRTDDKGMKSVAYIDLLIAKIAELEARLEKLEK